MATTEPKKNIYQRMSAVTAEISAVAKNLEVGFGQSKYKAVGEADVLAAVKPAEKKHGVYSYPYSREIIESEVLTTVDRNGQEKKSQFLRMKTIYRFVNVDKPDEYIDVATYGDGVDPQDKAPGKAMTYGDKYALLKAYKIITGDDPDQHASQELRAKSNRSADLARAAYPSREEMLDVAMQHFTGEKQRQLFDAFGVTAFDQMSDAQVMTAFNNAVRVRGKA